MTLEAALKLLDQAAQGDEPLGTCPETGKPVYLKVGRFGPYVQRGTPEDEEKPQNASLLKGMNPADIDLATALKLLTLPRNLGDHPQQVTPVMAYNGRFGPYVKCGEETRSLPADLSPLDVTLEQAVHLLSQPKQRGRGARRQTRTDQGLRRVARHQAEDTTARTAATALTSPMAKRTPRCPKALRRKN